MAKDHSDKREETRCRRLGYVFWLAARVLLYVSSYRQDYSYHGFCYPSHGALAGTRNFSMGPPWMNYFSLSDMYILHLYYDRSIINLL